MSEVNSRRFASDADDSPCMIDAEADSVPKTIDGADAIANAELPLIVRLIHRLVAFMLRVFRKVPE